MGKTMLLFVMMFIGLLSVEAQEPRQIQSAIRDILADRRYQKEISHEQIPMHDYSKQPRGRMYWSTSNGSSSSGVLKFLVYFIGTLCIAACVALILSRIINRPKTEHSQGMATGGSKTSQQIPEPEYSYQELFATGNIVDACRKILHDGLHVLRDRKLIPAGKSFTNRELIAQLGGQELQQPLQQIAGVVEKGYYAQLPVTEKDYESCLHNLETIRQATK